MPHNLIRAAVIAATAAGVLVGASSLAWADTPGPGGSTVTKEDLETLGWSCQYSGVNTEECTKGPDDGKYVCNMNADSCTWIGAQSTGGTWHIYKFPTHTLSAQP